MFLEKVVGGLQVQIWNAMRIKSLVKQNARTSAEPPLDFSYLLFEEAHCGIEVVHFDFAP